MHCGVSHASQYLLPQISVQCVMSVVLVCSQLVKRDILIKVRVRQGSVGSHLSARQLCSQGDDEARARRRTSSSVRRAGRPASGHPACVP